MLKKIKSLFFVEDKEVSKENTEIKQKKAEINSVVSPPTISAKDMNKFQRILLNALEENNQEGYDYLEFRHSLQALKKVTSDENQRVLSALSMLSSVNSSPKKLIDSGTIYLNVLAREKKIFEEALMRQKSKMIDVKNQELKHTKELIKDKQSQIKALSKEIIEHEKSVLKLKEVIKNADGKINENKQVFEQAFNKISAEIKADLNRINDLKGTL